MNLAKDAKQIAFYFFDKTETRATKAIISKTIIQAKSILNAGYSLEEIIDVIDYLIDVKKVNLFSLGYISSAISNVLNEINKHKSLESKSQIAEETKKAMSLLMKEQQCEVVVDNESKQRNADKISGFSFQSRLREKFDFDMFEEQR